MRARPLALSRGTLASMRAVGTLISAIAGGLTPNGSLARMRLRATLDMLITLVVTQVSALLRSIVTEGKESEAPANRKEE